ncbi:hypothetical protein J2777_002961 [Paraburkholderia graminis]|uniref:hypothetical protein n=1 Tax=Paraburkholderia graminis TaxID=60548 RepID=UPI0028554B69|nr:hypothetical protein [Paraburkholderia graminis]MDR6469233.1 hypothetical protein [Paraburkholderia graminis]
MPTPLDLQSEPFSATGGAAAEGVSNQLGRPRADRFTLLVREAVQNSWDARLAPAGGVQFQVDGLLLDWDARHALSAQVFANAPAAVDIRSSLLADGDFPVLAVSDFGTRGLSGPTRGNVVPHLGESTNFVDFMRYIGRPPNRPHAGGTYGFGKAAYFLASSLKTICVHTRFRNEHGIESRFMAAALGPQFETSGPEARRYTGRHWWGRLARDEVVDPVVGDEADALALLLGGARRAPDALGTTVYVLAPDFEGASPQQVLRQMGRAIIDYFWPKLIDGAKQTPTMSFSVRWQGSELPLPKVQDEPELALLARAFASASAKAPFDGVVLEPIASQRPKRLLGHLALVRQPTALMGSVPAAREGDDHSTDLYRRVLRRPVRQIALMRAPNFVVKYMEGPLVPYELAEYGGVFRVDADADAAFARAEPPTHDDWVPDLLLDASEKSYVRVALRRVKDAVDAFAAPHLIEAAGAGPHSVAGFSRLLGGLVPSLAPATSGPAGRTDGSNGGGSGRSGTGRTATTVPQISFVGEPLIELVDGVTSMIARFEASSLTGEPVRVLALPKVVIAGGFENDPPEGAQQPVVLRWLDPNGDAVARGVASCDVPPNGGTWTVVVSIPPDAMISVALRAEARVGA